MSLLCLRKLFPWHRTWPEFASGLPVRVPLSVSAYGDGGMMPIVVVIHLVTEAEMHAKRLTVSKSFGVHHTILTLLLPPYPSSW